MKNKHFIILILVVIFSQPIVAQSFRFTTDTAYLNEMSAFVQKSKKPEVIQLYTEFSSVWTSAKLSQKQKVSIINVSNNMLKKRALVFPHFYNYMKFIILIVNSQKQASQFDTWHRVFENYTEDKSFNTSRINKIFESFILLNDSDALYKSRAVVWKYNNDNFRLQLVVDQEPKV